MLSLMTIIDKIEMIRKVRVSRDGGTVRCWSPCTGRWAPGKSSLAAATPLPAGFSALFIALLF
eukprot:12888973-Prorocentrum_lima.AAC.1